MNVVGFDHLVLTVRDLAATCRFYVDGLGLRHERFGEGRHALHLGAQKINLHEAGREFEPKAAHPVPGSADFCLLTEEALETVAARMAALGHPVLLGPVRRTGATGPILSLYFRDPDGNLVEVARPLE
ncbi:MAG TPA: VOC family protein [Rhodospirillales bacterium]|nr:VOC family protein [Rhodospirillales bacterium]